MNRHQLFILLSDYFGLRRKPLILQISITSRQNSRCVTCNVWKKKEKTDIDADALRKALNDPFFSEVIAVGLNGGEFTLVPSFLDILSAVLSLPKLSSITLITNGLLPTKLFEVLEKGKLLCDERNVHLNVCLSVDGVALIHEQIRGVPNCFSKSKEILEELSCHKDKYCHSYFIGCTLSRNNISHIRETEAFFGQYKNVPIEYHLTVPNKRIGTFEDYERYFVLTDEEARHLATEFFYERFLKAGSQRERQQYFANYYFLRYGKRLCKCDFKLRDITINEDMEMSLCATASDAVGDLKKDSASVIVKSKHIDKEYKSIKQKCSGCIHYSYHPLTIKGQFLLIHEILKNRFALAYYDAMSSQRFASRMKRLYSLTRSLMYESLRLIYHYIWRLQ